jgi:hypothetical protein
MGSHWVYIIQCNDSKNYKGVGYFKNIKIGCVFNVVGNCSWLLWVLAKNWGLCLQCAVVHNHNTGSYFQMYKVILIMATLVLRVYTAW